MNSPEHVNRSFLIATVVVLLSTICVAQPAIKLSTHFGPPTSRILISGRGFFPNETLTKYFDGVPQGQLTTDSNGAFSNAAITVPKDALPGKHSVGVLEPAGTRFQVGFDVDTSWAEFGFDGKVDRNNPFENVLNHATVGSLTQYFSFQMRFGCFSAPAVSHGILYVGSADSNLYALDALTGGLLWSYQTLSEIYSSSPSVYNGVVYFGSEDRYIYALDAKTGDLKWKFLTYDCCDIWSSPTLVNNIVYIGGGGPTMYALNASTGTPIWTFSSGDLISAAPAVANGMVYFTSYDQYVYALHAADGSLAWKFQTPYGLLFIAPVVADGLVYINSISGLYAFDAVTGQIVWADYSVLGEGASPAAANGIVYAPTSLGVTAYDGKTGQKLWTNSIPVPSSYFAVANGVLYLNAYDGNMYALDASTGAILWSFFIGRNYLATPIVANGMLYFPGGSNMVFGFGLPGMNATH